MKKPIFQSLFIPIIQTLGAKPRSGGSVAFRGVAFGVLQERR